jgi:hypothetical protein
LHAVTTTDLGNVLAWKRAGDLSALLRDEAAAVGAWRRASDAVTLGESRAARYEKHLAPLAAALERAGVD